MNNKNFYLNQVAYDGLLLQKVSNEFKKNMVIVLAAVRNNGHALEFCSYELQNNKIIVMTAVKNKCSSLQYASKNLKNDKNFMLELLKINTGIIKFLTNKIVKQVLLEVTKHDCSLLLNNYVKLKLIYLFTIDNMFASEMVKNYGYLLKFTSTELQNNKECVLQAVKNDGIAIKYASYELANNKEIVLQAISSNPLAFDFISNYLKDDEEIIYLTVNNNYDMFDHCSEHVKQKYMNVNNFLNIYEVYNIDLDYNFIKFTDYDFNLYYF